MSDVLTRSARGRDCTIRLENICNFDPATTVLAHYRISGISGIGLKSPSVLAAFSCSSCHDAADRRTHLYLERDYVQLAHLRGVMRTQAIWLREGAIVVRSKHDR